MTTFTQAECERVTSLLCRREREVLTLMMAGYQSKEIAARLDISLCTVKVHRERIYSKLGVNGLAQAVRVATTAKVI